MTKKLKSFPALVFDTETTGLIENRTVPLDRQPEVVEFYGCVADLATGEVSRELDLLIKPSRLPLPAIITKVTGLTDAALADAPSFTSKADSIFKMIESVPLVIAHNAAFDKGMLDLEAERLGRAIKWPRLVCTIEWTVHVKGYRLNLSALHEHLFGEPHKGAHRARADVQALLRCAVELYKREMIT